MNIARRVIGAAKIFTKGKLFTALHTLIWLLLDSIKQIENKKKQNRVEGKRLQEMERARQ